MAEKVVVELEAKTGKAEANIQDVVDAIKDLGNKVSDTSEKSDKSFKDIEKSTKGVSKGIKKLATGFKGVGLAMKAAGFGLVMKVVDKLTEALGENQVIADTVNTAFTAIGIVAKQITDIFVDVFKNVSDATGGFDALQKVLGGALSISINLVVGAIQGMMLGVKKAQLAWEDSFLGGKDPETIKRLQQDIQGIEDKLSETGDRIKKSGKDIADNFIEAVGEVGTLAEGVAEGAAKAIEKIDVKTAISDAKRLVKSKKNFERLALQQQRLVEQYDLQAEQQRQIRDDESKSIEERIDANNKLAQVLLDQNKAEKATVQARIDALKEEQRLKGVSVELSNEIYALETELAAIDAKVTGFKSEQLTNENSLIKEKKDLLNEISLIGKTERELERLELQQDYDAKKLLIEREITDEAQKKEALANLETDYNTKIAEINQNALNDKIAIAEKESELEKQKIRDKAAVVDAISQFADAESGIGKALLIIKQGLALKETLMDLKRITFKGTQAVAEAGVSTAENVANSSKIGFPQNIITIAGAIAQGVGIVRSVKQAVSKTKAKGIPTPTPLTSPIASTSTASQPPAFNVVGASSTDQLAEAIGSQQQKPVKAYVVSQDVTTAQSLDRNIIDGASI